MEVKTLIEHLQQRYQPDDVIAASLWVAEDVLIRAAESGITLTRDQAEAVLDMAEDHHDANVGISWDVLDIHIETLTRLSGDA